MADYLVARGFQILARNVRMGALEIDLVARLGDLAAIVEVRTRGSGAFARGLESIDGVKRRRIVLAAERLWRERLSKVDGLARVRLDVASVTFDGDDTRVEYIEAALTG